MDKREKSGYPDSNLSNLEDLVSGQLVLVLFAKSVGNVKWNGTQTPVGSSLFGIMPFVRVPCRFRTSKSFL